MQHSWFIVFQLAHTTGAFSLFFFIMYAPRHTQHRRLIRWLPDEILGHDPAAAG